MSGKARWRDGEMERRNRGGNLLIASAVADRCPVKRWNNETGGKVKQVDNYRCRYNKVERTLSFPRRWESRHSNSSIGATHKKWLVIMLLSHHAVVHSGLDSCLRRNDNNCSISPSRHLTISQLLKRSATAEAIRRLPPPSNTPTPQHPNLKRLYENL